MWALIDILRHYGVRINNRLSSGEEMIVTDKFKLGLGGWRWEMIGIDYVALILNSKGKLITDRHFVFYNSDMRLKVQYPGVKYELLMPITITYANEWQSQSDVYVESRPTDPELSVVGPMEYRCSPNPEFTDDAEMDINLANIHPDADQIVVCACSRHSPLGKTELYVRLYNSNEDRFETDLYYELVGEFPSFEVVELCRLFKYQDLWKIKASNKGYTDMEHLLDIVHN